MLFQNLNDQTFSNHLGRWLFKWVSWCVIRKSPLFAAASAFLARTVLGFSSVSAHPPLAATNRVSTVTQVLRSRLLGELFRICAVCAVRKFSHCSMTRCSLIFNPRTETRLPTEQMQSRYASQIQ